LLNAETTDEDFTSGPNTNMKRESMSSKCIVYLIGLFCVLAGSIAAQTEADVGDIDSFMKEAKFAGYAVTGKVGTYRDCSLTSIPHGPDDRCVTITTTPTSNYTNFDLKNIGRIRFPPSTFQNVIYLLPRHRLHYSTSNSSTESKVGNLSYEPYITLISSVLEDPNLINPINGLPFAGRIYLPIEGRRFLSKTLFPNYQEADTLAYGSPSISGINKRFLKENYGLQSTVVDEIFRKEITILLNIKGWTTNINGADFDYAVRFLGN